MFGDWRRGYHVLPTDGADEDDASAKVYEHIAADYRARRTATRVQSWIQRVKLLTVVNVALLVTAIWFWAGVYKNMPSCTDLMHDPRYTTTRNAILKQSSSYSPIFDALTIRTKRVRFNGAVHDEESIFRQDPSPEVDRAWERLSMAGHEVTTVSGSALRLSGKNESISIKAPPEWNRGEDSYIAQIDVFHQIHCLNEIRKELHSNYPYYYGQHESHGEHPAPQPQPHSHSHSSHASHKKHCLHVLLQNILCHADLEVIPHVWRSYADPDKPVQGMADFNTEKQCRDFDQILEWAQGNAIENLEEMSALIKPPADAVVLDGTDGYF